MSNDKDNIGEQNKVKINCNSIMLFPWWFRNSQVLSRLYPIWCYTTDAKKRWEFCDPKPDVPNSTSLGECWVGDTYGSQGNSIEDAPIKDVGSSGHKDGSKLARCEGDCDSTNDCEDGLICQQRSGDTPVPGCSGKPKRNWDYCVNPLQGNTCKDIEGYMFGQTCTNAVYEVNPSLELEENKYDLALPPQTLWDRLDP